MKYPAWLDESEGTLLRNVAEKLYVGGKESAKRGPTSSSRWDLVIDLHGVTCHDSVGYICWRFEDGQPFPDKSLERIETLVRQALSNPLTSYILFCCEVGRSRSASCAYAMMRKIYDISHEEALSRIQTETSFTAGDKVLRTQWPRRRTLASARDWVEAKEMS